MRIRGVEFESTPDGVSNGSLSLEGRLLPGCFEYPLMHLGEGKLRLTGMRRSKLLEKSTTLI